MFYDVIVIGAGLAGLMAAEAAQEKGSRVLILAKGMGSLPLTSGCVDGLGYFPESSAAPVSSPLETLGELNRVNPAHPYSRLGKESILSALARFQDLTLSNGLPYAGGFDATVLIPTALGTYHPTCLVPETMKNGVLSLPGRVLLLGFEGLKDFSVCLASENLNLWRARGKIAPSFRAETLTRVKLEGKALNSLNLARAFDGEEFRERVARQVQPLLKSGEKLGLPAVLGYSSSQSAWADLQKRLGTDIFEVPLPPPSIPGLRLYNLMRARLQEKGVRVIIGLSALKPILEKGEIQGIALGEARKSPVYRASAYVLATGKFVGGGLDAQRNRIFETLFDLPVEYPQNRKEWFTTQLLTSIGQPFNSFGVEVNENLQPTDSGGKVIYQNLHAAGGILSHADSMAEKSGGGVAIATGYVAGQFAAACARKGFTPEKQRVQR
jgi:glycerol-3-phosphate dehydrogenase subunit B